MYDPFQEEHDISGSLANESIVVTKVDNKHWMRKSAS